MSDSDKLIVFRNRETGEFLESYKDRGSLAFEVEYCCLVHALKLPLTSYEENKERFDGLAKVFDCEIIVAEMDFNLSHLDGGEVEPIAPKSKKEAAEAFINQLFRGLADV